MRGLFFDKSRLRCCLIKRVKSTITLSLVRETSRERLKSAGTLKGAYIHQNLLRPSACTPARVRWASRPYRGYLGGNGFAHAGIEVHQGVERGKVRLCFREIAHAQQVQQHPFQGGIASALPFAQQRAIDDAAPRADGCQTVRNHQPSVVRTTNFA
jgi:hypothetical protein